MASNFFFFFILENCQFSICVSLKEYAFPSVDADAGVQPSTADAEATPDEELSAKNADSDAESIGDDQEVKKKSKKEKVGFRDRKVCVFENGCYTLLHRTRSIHI